MSLSDPQTLSPKDNVLSFKEMQWEKYKSRKKLYFLFTFIFLAIVVGVTFFGINKYNEVVLEVQDIDRAINGDAEVNIIGLKDQIQQKEQEKNAKQEKIKEKNRDLITKLYKVLPVKTNTKVLTNIVRLFESLTYNLHSPSKSDPIIIKSIMFGKEETQGSLVAIPVQMTLTASERNFYQFLYFLETSGNLEPKDVFDENKFKALEEMLTDAADKEKLLALKDSDYTVESLLSFRNGFLKNNELLRQVDRVLTKPLLYKKFESLVDPRYYPAQFFSIESVNFNYLEKKGSEEIIKNEGELQINLKIKAYTQAKDIFSQILQ